MFDIALNFYDNYIRHVSMEQDRGDFLVIQCLNFAVFNRSLLFFQADSGVRKSERKRKPKYPGGGDMAEPIKKRSQPRNPVNMSSKTPVAKALPESQILSIDTPDRMKAPTLPDEVSTYTSQNTQITVPYIESNLVQQADRSCA